MKNEQGLGGRGREEKRVSMQIVHKPRALLVREREKYKINESPHTAVKVCSYWT